MDDGSIKATPVRDARRQAILQIARDVFVEEGFGAASMSAIAARVGGSKGTLYNYFASKQELFSAVIQDECDRKHDALFGGLTADDDLETVMRDVGRRYVDVILSERTIAFSRAVIAEAARFPDLGRVLYEAGPQRGQRRLEVFVAHAMQAGLMREDDPARVVQQYCDMCLAGGYRNRLMNVVPPPSPEKVAEDVESALTVILTTYGVETATAA